MNNRGRVNFLVLSPKQVEVIHMYGDGLTYAEIGERLHISRNTVKDHIVKACVRNGAVNSANLAVLLTRAESRDGVHRIEGLKITFQQRRILLLLSTGLRAGEVQRRLGISKNTYHSHLSNIREVTGCRTVGEAIYKATNARLLG